MGSEDSLGKAHSLVSLLVAPTVVQTGEPKTWFLNLLTKKIQDYSQAVDGILMLAGTTVEGEHQQPMFDYVRCCVHALVNLKLELINAVDVAKKVAPPLTDAAIKGPRLEADALSISQQKSVSSILEMMIVLGVLPNLLPGVGVSVHKRSEFLQLIFKDLPKYSILEKYKQLVFTLDALLDLASHRSLSGLVLTKHMGDILASLVQISHAPLIKPADNTDDVSSSADTNLTDVTSSADANSNSVEVTTSSTDASINLSEADNSTKLNMDSSADKFVMTADLYSRLTADQQRYNKELNRLTMKSYQPTIVRNLIVLAASAKGAKTGGATVGKPAPKWFSKKVAELLTARLMAENGVANVIRGVLDMGGGDTENNMDWQKVGLVATVLGNPPEGNYASVEKYYQLICPQIIEILNNQADKVYQMIACASIKAVTERSLILSRRYLLDVVMDPFIRLADKDEKVGLAVTEQELDDCLKSLFKIFVIGTDPCVIFLSNLDKIILELLEVHASITFGVSHLRDPVKQIITRYLKHMSSETTIEAVRAWALQGSACDLPAAKQARMLSLHKDLLFGHGEEGGIVVKAKVSAEQSFYLSDDEKSIVVQDLLEDLKDPKLVVDFYLGLTADLTGIMTDEVNPEPELPPLEPGGDIEKQLLEIEATMDAQMNKMRRNLMVIRLLGLYSEDKTLQENLMKESPRLIKFIGASIQRAAKLLKTDVAVDESSCVMASQSLNMSLTILSLHLTRAEVSADDWRRMQEYSDDLKVLSGHPDPRISRLAGQLHQLVCAQAEVMENIKVMKEKTKNIQEETKKFQAKADELKDKKKDSENAMMDERKQQLKDKADSVAAAKVARKKKVGLKEEEAEIKILEDKEGLTPYAAALYDVQDPLLPVRGHGIIELNKLVETKDKETLEHVSLVFQLFVDSLEDDDTYIYLSCINGLVSCARYQTDKVLDILTREFSQVYQRKDLGDKAVEVRTKIGEALVRATKELGDLTPKYKNLLLNAFFGAASDPEELVRASSLSNLGEVCRNIRFSLGPIAGELMMHLEASARDKAVQVRRAAAMVLTMMLEGLGRDAFSILEQYLRDIHRSLRQRLGTETDDVTLTHVNLALDEIDKIVRELFSPQLSQEPRVFVTN
jgi:hypothetical protein